MLITFNTFINLIQQLSLHVHVYTLCIVMLVTISFTHVLNSSTIFLLHLELKPKNGFKLKTGFDCKRSVLVRLTF